MYFKQILYLLLLFNFSVLFTIKKLFFTEVPTPQDTVGNPSATSLGSLTG